MPITLGSNIASLKSQRRLADGTASLSKTFERLSSGQRINKASDDAAGLAIADSLNAKSRVFNQGVRNLGDGLSLLSIADSAIETLSGIMIRLEELAEQSANGVYSNQQRKALDAEAQALSGEFLRISKTAAFNGQRLFTGELQAVNLQAGIGSEAVLSAGVGGAIGTGTFQSATSLATESGASKAVALGDLNGDGFLDLVTAGYIDDDYGYTTVRLGTGSGSFGASSSFMTAGNAYTNAVALGDINNDGILDLVTIGNEQLLYHRGRGDGTFSYLSGMSLNDNIESDVALADLNGDGTLDLIRVGGGFVVHHGLGGGSFDSGTTYSTMGSLSSVMVGDLNGDGIPDFVAAGGGFAVALLGAGDGSFGPALSYQAEAFSWSVALGDLNGDGVLDLVTAGSTAGDGYATVRLGHGNGTFGAATSYATESNHSLDVALGDINGDGNLDIVTAGSADGGGGYATLRLGAGDGSFGFATSYATESLLSSALALGDLNSDGVLDLVSAGRASGPDGYATIRLSDTVDGVAPLLPFSLNTLADARQALPVFRRKREQLASQRGEIGAFQSRIGVATNVLTVSSENFKAAESRIRDADIAEESSKLVRLNILQQAASSVLAQANQQPALALQLLTGR